jgi:hypothetical protein
MLTGLQIARNGNREMRFMTLTTSNNRVKNRNGKTRELRDSFQILRQRIKRATKEKDSFQGFNLNKYYCIRTSEGNGVLHIIFWGGNYIPHKWLKANWQEIHGAFIVDIRFVHNLKHTVQRLVGYLLDRYLLNQPIERMSYGWGWAWLGFCKSWKHIKDTHGMLKRGTGNLKMQHITGKIINADNWKEYIVPFRDKIDCKQPVPVWKCLLWCHPVTSRQIKFYYPKSGYNKNFF